MNEETRCSQCGAELAANAPRGLCPACLLKGGLGTETGASAGGAAPAAADYVPPTPAELAPLFPDLEILELVGRGGMGVVYRARQKHLDRLVALKILAPKSAQDPAFAERFQREARAMAMLSHPQIVAVHDFGQTGGLYYFLMEFVDGPNLRRLLDVGKLAPEEALAIVPQICDALQYAHDHGVVHRDIKPENVLIDKEGRVKIADFGIAKLVGTPSRRQGREAGGEGEPFTSPFPPGERQPLKSPLPPGEGQGEGGGRPASLSPLTAAGQVMGTPQYMAPEQVEHPLQVDHRADIYSLGVVFYQMLTGELPIGRFAAPSKKVQIDVRLDEVVLRALEKEPERRYQQASEIKTRVETIATTPAVAVSPPALQRGRASFVEYRSRVRLFGLPLVHIAMTIGPSAAQRRVARGIIAIGDIAQGVIALGGLAIGGLAIGGAAIGVFAFGGAAAALLLAVGGGAIGFIADGGGAVGYWARGGGALGVHTVSAMGADPAARQFFDTWFPTIQHEISWTVIFAMLVVLIVGLLPLLMLLTSRTGSAVGVKGPPLARAVTSAIVSVAVCLAMAATLLPLMLGKGWAAISPPSDAAHQGWKLWERRRMTEAIAKFSEAVKVDPKDANSWNGLGWASFNSGKFPEAEKAFQQAVALSPEHPAALNGLGQLALTQRKYGLAEKYLLKAAPQASAAWYGLARLYLLQGKFAEAEKWAQKVVDSGEASADARRFLDAAKKKRLPDDLRRLIEPPKSRPTKKTP